MTLKRKHKWHAFSERNGGIFIEKLHEKWQNWLVLDDSTLNTHVCMIHRQHTEVLLQLLKLSLKLLSVLFPSRECGPKRV